MYVGWTAAGCQKPCSTRNCTRKKLSFQDVLKRHVKRIGIPHDTWEEEALQRAKWRGLLRKAMSAVEEQRQQEYQHAHDRRHSAAPLTISNATIVSVTADPERV